MTQIALLRRRTCICKRDKRKNLYGDCRSQRQTVEPHDRCGVGGNLTELAAYRGFKRDIPAIAEADWSLGSVADAVEAVSLVDIPE